MFKVNQKDNNGMLLASPGAFTVKFERIIHDNLLVISHKFEHVFTYVVLVVFFSKT